MGPSAEPKGLVFNVQKFSVHDGPGIRTTVFLKGCPLRCFWCCNPESQDPNPEISRNGRKCLGPEQCGACLEVCPSGALSVAGGSIARDREACLRCAACADICPSGCVNLVGRWMSAEEVLRAVSADAVFYDHSGGGFTFSGGEPLLQADFVAAVCERAVREGLSPSLETCAAVPYANLQKVCGYLSHGLVDIKHMDSERHRQATGVDNRRILANIRRMAREFPDLPLTIRMPIIPGFNDDPEAVIAVARLVGELTQAQLELLPYHRLGEGKYENLGLGYGFAGKASPSSEQMDHLRRAAKDHAAVI